MSEEITGSELVQYATNLLDAVPGLDGSPEHFLLSSIAYSLAAIAKATVGPPGWTGIPRHDPQSEETA